MTSSSLDLVADHQPVVPRHDLSLTAVVPCFNEEACLERAYQEIRAVLSGFADYEILFVDDGSRDRTLELIKSFARDDEHVKYLSFARNFGLEAAFSAGFRYAGKKWTVQLDADLQSPPSEIHKLVDRALDGYDIVFGVRADRRDPWPRRMGSLGQQFVARRMLGIDLPLGASVFRVVRTSVARKIVTARPRSPYFIATAPLLGARYTTVATVHHARLAGTPKWNLAKLVAHSFDLWFGFSVRPLALVALVTALAPVGVLTVLAVLAVLGHAGWPAVAVTTLILDTVAVAALGVLVTYLIPVLRGTGALPRYLIRESNVPIDAADDLYEGERTSVGRQAR